MKVSSRVGAVLLFSGVVVDEIEMNSTLPMLTYLANTNVLLSPRRMYRKMLYVPITRRFNSSQMTQLSR
jgi:hypothetical protein